MSAIIRFIKYTFLSAICFGCATIPETGEKEIINSWINYQVEDVFLVWGIPDRNLKLSDGRMIYEWSNQRIASMPSFVSTTNNSINFYGSDNYSAACKRTLITDKNGMIVSGISEGNDCCSFLNNNYCLNLGNPKNKPKPFAMSRHPNYEWLENKSKDKDN